ncbi:MAG: GNAT family N-acetyltransferase [Acidobacteriota bacterium]
MIAPTPFHSEAWRSAAWAGDDAPRLTVHAGGLRLDGALRSVPGHDYHHPAPLLGSSREAPFLDPQQRRRWRQLPWAPVLTTVSPFGYRGSPPYGELDLPQARSLADELVAAARRQRCSALLSHYLFDQDDGPWMQALQEAGAQILTLGAHCRMNLNFPDLEAYHRWLGKSRRTVRAPRSWNCSGAEVWWTDEALDEGLARELTSLLRRKLHRFGSPGPPRYLLARLVEGSLMKRWLFVAQSPGQAPRSVLVSIPWGETLYAKFFASQRSSGDYIPLVFNHQIQAALERGFRRIDFGGAAHRAKLFRGATLHLARGAYLPLRPELQRQLPLAQQLSQLKEGAFLALSRRWQKKPAANAQQPDPAASPRRDLAAASAALDPGSPDPRLETGHVVA